MDGSAAHFTTFGPPNFCDEFRAHLNDDGDDELFYTEHTKIGSLRE